MSGVKHTPSWRWERLGCRVYENKFYRGRSIRVADLSVARLDEDELNLRGRLIAAAPDLLEACLEAAKTFRRYEALHLEKGTVEGAQKAAANASLAKSLEAAIARARGEQDGGGE